MKCRLHRGIQYTREELPDERDIENRMNLQLLSQDKSGILCIQKYSNNGFTLNNGLKLKGPTAFFPRSFLSWRVSSIRDVNESSLALFLMLAPKPDLFLLGIGSSEEKVDRDVIRVLREQQINFEILPTEKAIATFNFLVSEHRWVAAGLIPPRNLVSEDRKDMEALMDDKRQKLDYLSDDEEDEYKKIASTPPPSTELPEHNLFGYEIMKSPLEKIQAPRPKNYWMFTENVPADHGKHVAGESKGEYTAIGERPKKEEEGGDRLAGAEEQALSKDGDNVDKTHDKVKTDSTQKKDDKKD